MNRNQKGENQILQVSNFQELASTLFQGEINAMSWSRKLVGDFAEIIQKVELEGNMAELSTEDLLQLELTEQGQLAREILISDMELLKNQGASPILNIIKNYEKDESYPEFPTDVYSYHVDRSPVPTATFLCTYYGASSDILPNAQGIQKILVPEIRAELKKLYGGNDEGFEAFLSEYFFDLHYQELPNAQPISMGVGHLWKIAVDHPDSEVLPCLHRAPEEKDGKSRLLLIC
ncbi:hypothetical protein [Brumimicrobium mesophilum]|uniref:hypothetical protein n=1 Tax=Brumimicrobium mesophilum TaxID=392717 RepID=UPI000D142C67|nr:hypothetical protein [Brumimicrobium mesophilum]